ncbi:MAG: HPF/RaiA family ribosome-associated protein [Pseudomonadota bacterium]
MQVPLRVTYRNMDASEAIDVEIRKRVDKLSQKHGEVVSCRIVVDAPPQHRRKGGLFKVRIDITCPDGKVSVNKEHAAQNKAHGDVYVALRDSFNAADRQLDQYRSRRKGDVKIHEEAPSGKITHLSPIEDYGLITTTDNREIYFHRNSVLHADFDTLEIGMKVRFHEEEGNNGPQASTVRVEG